MAFNMRNRSLLSLMHHTTRELHYLLDLSRDLKRAKYTGTERPHLQGKSMLVIQMIGGLIQDQQIGFRQKGAQQSHAHGFSTAEC